MTDSKKIWVLYSAAILFGAFLMFLVQPLIGKVITPMYGGSSQVWAVCLLFFQLTLLGGYGLTWALSKLQPKQQAIAYMLLMGVSAFLVNIPLGNSWVPADASDPVYSLLGKLLAYLTLPAILLSTVSTTIQNWFRIAANQSPFQLYSISNIGSMGALIAYPILIEPNATVVETLTAWTWGYRLLVLCAIGAALILLNALKKNDALATASDEVIPGDEDRTLPTRQDFLRWIGLAALGTSLLISFTNFITHNIAPVPLLWILPLITYLLTFILCFGSDNFYKRAPYILMAQLSLGVLCFYPTDPFYAILLNIVTLFLLCVICHGEIYTSRPKANALPVFYLSIALGGAMGGVIMNLLVPVLFNRLVEYGILLVILALISIVLAKRHNLRIFYNPIGDKVYYIAALVLVAVYAYTLTTQQPGIISQTRNFYGSATVAMVGDTIQLTNGTTLHGSQPFDREKKRFLYVPTTYFTPLSGAGIANTILQKHRGNQPIRTGIIGLGAGTLATYARPGDKITYYELDPKIDAIARKNFRFLADCHGDWNVVLGDGRLKLQDETAPTDYDMIIIDAFSSDAIPVHLITREALQLYRKHLKPDGLIVFHLSNRFLDLSQVTGNLAIDQGLQAMHIYSKQRDAFHQPSIYTIMSPAGWFKDEMAQLDFDGDYKSVHYWDAQREGSFGVWTDNYSNLWSIMLFGDEVPAKWGAPNKPFPKKTASR